MSEKILILDYGSQYTQLIARAVREANVYCEIIPYHKPFEFEPGLKGIILSGSPCSVNEDGAPDSDLLKKYRYWASVMVHSSRLKNSADW